MPADRDSGAQRPGRKTRARRQLDNAAGGTEHSVAQGFRTGANTAGYTLTSIDLQLDVATSAIPPTVTLHRGSAAGSTVADFTAPSTAPGGGFAAYTFTPTSTPMLEPNTDYWVVARGASRWIWSVTGLRAPPTPGVSYRERSEASHV